MTQGDKLKDLIIFARQISWQYQLSAYTDEALKSITKSLDVARNELLAELDMKDFRLPPGRENQLLDNLNDLTFGVQKQLVGDIAEAAAIAGELSYQEYGKILSFDGKVAEKIGFNFVSVSAAQLQSMALTTPVGGRLLQDWVRDTFAKNLVEDIKTDIMAGYLKGEGTGKLVDRIREGFNINKRDAITLTRTYVADVNNRALDDVYKANKDIIKEVEWSATLEVSTKSGFGTCPRCAGLHGRRWKLDDPNQPHAPLHHRCRCTKLSRTADFKELGLDIPELEEMAKPYSVKEGVSIDVGGKRKTIEAGLFKGDFESFLKSRDSFYQVNLLGPNRYRMWKSGEIKWADLVDGQGNMRLLKKNKDGEYVGLMK